jgi:hypothetical protein
LSHLLKIDHMKMSRMIGRNLLSALLLALLVSVGGAVAHAGSPDAPVVLPNNMLQFTTAGHVLGFDRDGVYIASADHMLQVTFANTRGATPVADAPASATGMTPPLTRVAYENVWDGITVTYEAVAGGVVKSAYCSLRVRTLREFVCATTCLWKSSLTVVCI